MSKTILTEVKGWTPLIDVIVQEYDVMTAAVFGRVWRYCQGAQNVCTASIETIANELNISQRTVIYKLEELTKSGFLIDMTPELRNRPHTYADAGKVTSRQIISFELSPSQSDEVCKKSTPDQTGMQNLQSGMQNLQSRYAKFADEDTTEETIKETYAAEKKFPSSDQPDNFEKIQRCVESVTGNWISGQNDITALRELVASGVTEDDIRAAAVWLAEQGKRVIRASHLVKPSRVEMGKRNRAAVKHTTTELPAYLRIIE